MNSLEQEKVSELKQTLNVIIYKVALPLYFAFWLLDLIYVPQYKWEFLGIRCLIIPTVLITHWWLKRVHTFQQAERVALFLAFVCASLLNSMIFMIGHGALYSIALHLVAISGLSFVPWSRRCFYTAAMLIYGPYLVFEFVTLSNSADYAQFGVNSFFIVSVIVITWVIKSFRERLRNREFSIRNDLEQEINKRKQTEQELIIARDQALAATRAKESFLANMSHEIRTPLTAIIGFADTALDADQTIGQRVTALRTIRRSGDHLLSLINDILDFSKIEAGELQTEKRPINPLQQVAEVESIVMGQAKNKELDFGVDYEFPLPEIIHSDSVRIKQILLNLCSNAIKFTDKGSVRIAVRYDNLSNQLRFLVKDTGIGMTAEQLENIFKPFKQADESTARQFGGTGLGLSLSKHLADLLGGQLTAYSEPSKGSIFEFCLNLDVNEEIKLIHNIDEISNEIEMSDPVSLIKPLTGEILLAEDNKTNQQLIRMYLEKMGANVTCANNGEIALNLATQHTYDLIYMDMQMPVMSGVDAVRCLREQKYNAPIIMLTANATHEDKSLCLEAGADDFVTKPIVRQTLYETTARYLTPASQATLEGKTIVSELLQDDPGFQDIVHAYIDSLHEMHKQIIESFLNDDMETFHQLIHDVKGSAGGYGYPQLSQLAESIETHSKQQDLQTVKVLLDDLSAMCARICRGMQQQSACA